MRAIYEAAWADMPADPEPWAFARRRALLLAELRAGDRMLDLGCGAGRFAAAALDAGARVVGVDIADAALERARANAPGIELVRTGDDGSLALGHGEFDLVWCSEVIEHVPDALGLLQEVRRVLRPEGRLLLTTPYHGPVKNVLIALARFDAHFDPLGEHVRFFTRRSLAAALDAAGLEAASIGAAGGPPLLRRSLVARAVRP